MECYFDGILHDTTPILVIFQCYRTNFSNFQLQSEYVGCPADNQTYMWQRDAGLDSAVDAAVAELLAGLLQRHVGEHLRHHQRRHPARRHRPPRRPPRAPQRHHRASLHYTYRPSAARGMLTAIIHLLLAANHCK